MTQQLPARDEGLAPVSGGYVWDGAAWVPAGWTPPPVPAGEPDAATRAFGWVRCLPGRLQRAASAADRRPSGWEILVVLAIFPGVAVSSALVALAQTLANYSDNATHTPNLLPGHGSVSALLLLVIVVWDLAPALLVLYLLRLSGGGLRAIGLDRSTPRADIARSGKVVLYAFVPGFLLLAFLTPLTPHHDKLAQDPGHLALLFLLPSLVQALSAGVVEEIVVLGFLVHRLEQRGWDGWQLYAVCIAVRVSFHLYYGTGALGLIVWAGMSVFLYRRRRRVLTFIVAHAAWDVQAFLGTFFHGNVAWIPITGLVVVLALLWLVGRAPATAEMRESGRALARGETARPVPA